MSHTIWTKFLIQLIVIYVSTNNLSSNKPDRQLLFVKSRWYVSACARVFLVFIPHTFASSNRVKCTGRSWRWRLNKSSSVGKVLKSSQYSNRSSDCILMMMMINYIVICSIFLTIWIINASQIDNNATALILLSSANQLPTTDTASGFVHIRVRYNSYLLHNLHI